MKNYSLYAEGGVREDFQAKNDLDAVYLATKRHPNDLIAVYLVKDNGVSICVFETKDWGG